jgi:hypothetical protein
MPQCYVICTLPILFIFTWYKFIYTFLLQNENNKDFYTFLWNRGEKISLHDTVYSLCFCQMVYIQYINNFPRVCWLSLVWYSEQNAFLFLNYYNELVFLTGCILVPGQFHFIYFIIKNVGIVCTHMSKWLTVNTTALILSERNIHNNICSKKFPRYAVSIGYNVKYTDGSVNTKLPCLQTDNHPYWIIYE